MTHKAEATILNKNLQRIYLLFTVMIMSLNAFAQSEKYNEPFRPQVHFSPAAHWMNDPNGMVYNDGVYHLFYQYYPDSSVWGPMHWGHATSPDLIHWTHQPIALFPDSMGYIFSGSAVVDKNNTSGFGKNGKTPLVAIYTSHDIQGEKSGKTDFERQAIAYSLDNGKTWTKYSGNPVLPNNGIRDFRDPKVSWHQKEKKWVMILAVKDHVSFYSSPDLKKWTHQSDFGTSAGAHGGVWECPDFFPLAYNGKPVWVATVSINPGAPNGGSGTQYFTGSWDGKTFTPDDTETKWMDYGTDNYAGVTWSNTGNRRISIGWMSNWNYATKVPTEIWRSATTLPRELALKQVDDKLYLTSVPVKELDNIASPFKTLTNINATDYTVAGTQSLTTPYRLTINADALAGFALTFSNATGERLTAGYDKNTNQYFVDRTGAGESDFYKDFAARYTAPRLSQNKNMKLTIVIDVASIELFADDGMTVMTNIFFPKSLLNKIQISSLNNLTIQSLRLDKLNSIWK